MLVTQVDRDEGFGEFHPVYCQQLNIRSRRMGKTHVLNLAFNVSITSFQS
jgi:hypothetical protein